ncbi:uncharacterized protein L203_103011 [Cryptococcus depauperatus CBS 7841]|uniref:Mannosyltransferase n=1 Tax=Cryptococcus depauperatus CBS 7841 TaxID=1295531 RepID=A0A1E3IPT6_9TREE|nr:alpha-1,2-mannosyltransferase [Cryptococcus depauperatus CBS 7841]
MSLPGTETIRIRRPNPAPTAVGQNKEVEKKDEFGNVLPIGWKRRHQGLLQDQVARGRRGPFVPSLSLAFRILLLIRTAGAMYNIIADCDEVFNFFEPLHYFQYNSGFQTWELSPQFAVRSWFYILLHWPLAHLGPKLLRLDKRPAFFALRMSLGAICSFCEARFFRAVAGAINDRVARYLLVIMMLSAGMCYASVAFLPSSFAMYTTMLASSFWLEPANSTPRGTARAYRATFCYALGAIVGWPFSAALGIPFVFEQLFVGAGEIIPKQMTGKWTAKRFDTMIKAVSLSALIAVPVYLVDSWAYGRLSFPALNIVTYNLFSGNGPDLYGTSPSTFYLANLFLNFNIFLLFALVSLPALAVTYMYDYRRLGKTQMAPKEGETSPYMLMTLRLAPFYIWLTILTAQSHKEERFFFPAYPLLCFNAAVTIYLIRGWLEQGYVYLTKSPYNAGRTSIFSGFTLLVVFLPSLLSIARISAIFQFYHAPFDIAHHFQYQTLPAVLMSLGYKPIPLPESYKPYGKEEFEIRWDLSPLQDMEQPITLCYGTEWHRFPSSYLIPKGVQVFFIQTDFDGMMPRRWKESGSAGRWPRSETRAIRAGRFNGENMASFEPGTFIDPNECTYLVALSLPSQKVTELEPDWTNHRDWEREFCKPFLDASSSAWWSRLFHFPGGLLSSGRVSGDYCLLRHKGQVKKTPL